MIAGEGNRFESSFLGDSFNLFISALWLVRFYSPPLGTVTYLVHHNFKVGLNSLFFCKVYIFFQLTRFTVRRFTVRRFRVQLYSCIYLDTGPLKREFETFRCFATGIQPTSLSNAQDSALSKVFLLYHNQKKAFSQGCVN